MIRSLLYIIVFLGLGQLKAQIVVNTEHVAGTDSGQTVLPFIQLTNKIPASLNDQKIVSERMWFNESISNLSLVTDQVRLPEMTLLCPGFFNREVWGEFYYLDLRRLSQEIEKRDDSMFGN